MRTTRTFKVSGAVHQGAARAPRAARGATAAQQQAQVRAILAAPLDRTAREALVDATLAGATVDVARLGTHARMPGIAVGSASPRAQRVASPGAPRMPGLRIGTTGPAPRRSAPGRMPGIAFG